MEDGHQKSKNYYIEQSSNMNLISMQRRRKIAKLLQFLELLKAMSYCDGSTRQQSVIVGCHKRNSLDPRKEDFLKLIMQSSRFFKRDATLDYIVLYSFYDMQSSSIIFQNPVANCHYNNHLIS
jgi:hypothetical protein